MDAVLVGRTISDMSVHMASTSPEKLPRYRAQHTGILAFSASFQMVVTLTGIHTP